jgi:hypothetical protein
MQPPILTALDGAGHLHDRHAYQALAEACEGALSLRGDSSPLRCRCASSRSASPSRTSAGPSCGLAGQPPSRNHIGTPVVLLIISSSESLMSRVRVPSSMRLMVSTLVCRARANPVRLIAA